MMDVIATTDVLTKRQIRSNRSGRGDLLHCGILDKTIVIWVLCTNVYARKPSRFGSGNMASTAKKLRSYQVRLVTDVCRATENVLVEQPTGSGKTVQIVTLVAMHLGGRFTHAVISAPQEQIEQGFVKRDYQTIAFPACPGVAQPALAAPKHLIPGAPLSGPASVKQIAAY